MLSEIYFDCKETFVRFSAISTILKDVKNTQGGKSLLIKLLGKACIFTKSNILPWLFFTFF